LARTEGNTLNKGKVTFDATPIVPVSSRIITQLLTWDRDVVFHSSISSFPTLADFGQSRTTAVAAAVDVAADAEFGAAAGVAVGLVVEEEKVRRSVRNDVVVKMEEAGDSTGPQATVMYRIPATVAVSMC
jgi:hypothetical protein